MADSDDGGRNRIWADIAKRLRRETDRPEREAEAPAQNSPHRAASFDAGNMPDAVQRRYYSQSSRWSGEPAYFTTPNAEKPAFRDRGNHLVTDNESREVVKDLVAVAQHRGWERIQVGGSETFRRAVWLEAAEHGLEVRGYKPTDRDLQELDRIGTAQARNSIAPVVEKVRTELNSPAARQADGLSATPGGEPSPKAQKPLPAPPDGFERLSEEALDRAIGIASIRAGIDPETARDANRAYASANWTWTFSADGNARQRGRASVQTALEAIGSFATKSAVHAQIASAMADNHDYDMALVGNWYVGQEARDSKMLQELFPLARKTDHSSAKDKAMSNRSSGTTGAHNDRGRTNERAAQSQLRAMDIVVRAAFPNSAGTADRIMRYAREQMASHIADGKNVVSTRIKSTKNLIADQSRQSGLNRQPTSTSPSREHRPANRQRSR